MKFEIIKSESRGFFDHEWLKTYHSFSFADYYDPNHTNFGALRVLNDDVIMPRNGFGMHPHQNMEIITIPLTGSLEHEDSTGSKDLIIPGEVQVMSAGKGIVHSEKNVADIPVNLLQIWILTNQMNVSPRYDQKKFNEQESINKFQLLVSPDGRDESLWIYQNAFLSRIKITREKPFTYSLYNQKNGVFLFTIEGGANIAGHILNKRDSISISGEKAIEIKPITNLDLLFIEVPLINE
jgi:redox-sensitive bicupin YhaK (pirin superfamily)